MFLIQKYKKYVSEKWEAPWDITAAPMQEASPWILYLSAVQTTTLARHGQHMDGCPRSPANAGAAQHPAAQINITQSPPPGAAQRQGLCNIRKVHYHPRI